MQLEICGISLDSLPVRGYSFDPAAAKPGESLVTEKVVVSLSGTPAAIETWIQSIEVGLWYAQQYREKRIYLEQFIKSTPVSGGTCWRSPILWGTINRAAGGSIAARARGGMVGLEIILMRPDYWEDNAVTNIVSPAQTIGNGKVGANTNSITVDGTLLAGTLPAPAEVTIKNTNVGVNLGYIYLGQESWLDQFDNILEGEAMGAGDATITQTATAGAAYSNGEYMQLVGTLMTEKLLGTWSFSDMAINREYRLLLAMPVMDANVKLKAKFLVGTSVVMESDWITQDREVVDLGSFRIPPWNIPVSGWLPPTLTIGIYGITTVAGNHTLGLDYAALIPMNGGSVIFIPDITYLEPNDELWYNGENCLRNDPAGPDDHWYGAYLAVGNAIEIVPGNAGEITMVWARSTGAHEAVDVATVLVSARARVRSI